MERQERAPGLAAINAQTEAEALATCEMESIRNPLRLGGAGNLMGAAR